MKMFRNEVKADAISSYGSGNKSNHSVDIDSTLG